MKASLWGLFTQQLRQPQGQRGTNGKQGIPLLGRLHTAERRQGAPHLHDELPQVLPWSSRSKQGLPLSCDRWLRLKEWNKTSDLEQER